MATEKTPIVDMRVIQRVRTTEINGQTVKSLVEAKGWTLQFRRQGSDVWQDIEVQEVEEEAEA